MQYLNHVNNYDFISAHHYVKSPTNYRNKCTGFGFIVTKTNKKFNYSFEEEKEFNKSFIFKSGYFESSIYLKATHKNRNNNNKNHTIKITQCEKIIKCSDCDIKIDGSIKDHNKICRLLTKCCYCGY
jgi:hypothetical protein